MGAVLFYYHTWKRGYGTWGEDYLNREINQDPLENSEALLVSVFKFCWIKFLFQWLYLVRPPVCLCDSIFQLWQVSVFRALCEQIWAEPRAQCSSCPGTGQHAVLCIDMQPVREVKMVICSWIFCGCYSEQQLLFLSSHKSPEDSDCAVIMKCVNGCLHCHSQ